MQHQIVLHSFFSIKYAIMPCMLLNFKSNDSSRGVKVGGIIMGGSIRFPLRFKMKLNRQRYIVTEPKAKQEKAFASDCAESEGDPNWMNRG